MSALLRSLFIISLPLLLFTSNIQLATHSFALFRFGIDRYDIPQRMGLERQELLRVASELILYWDSPQERVSPVVRLGGMETNLFSDREVSHLKDVKSLVRFNRGLLVAVSLYGLFFVTLGLLRRRKKFLREFLAALGWGGAVTVSLLFLLGVAALVSFDRLFLLFHYLGFSNLLWVLNPATDRLIQMFPQGFFMTATLLVVGTALLEGLLLLALGFYLSRKLASRPD